MKILVTGGTGFLGTAIVKSLRKKNNKVYSLSRSDGKHTDDISCNLEDFSDIDRISKTLSSQNIDVVIHLASALVKKESDQYEVFEKNLKISEGLIRLVKSISPLKLINASSTAVYPEITGTFDEKSQIEPAFNSDALYGLSKFVSENLIYFNLKHTDIACIQLRIGQIYGDKMPEERIIPVLRKELLECSKITLFGSGERIIPLANIYFLVDVIEKFIKSKLESGVFNVVSENKSLIDIAKSIAEEEGILDPNIVLISNGKKSKFKISTKKLERFLQDIG